jgi:alpha-D-xyloside xylohydrolase
MVLACPAEPAAWSFETQFFFGPDILVAPCLAPGGGVEVYLPAGDWQRWSSGERLAGGRSHRLQLGLSDIAMFMRAGTTGLPTGEIRETA